MLQFNTFREGNPEYRPLVLWSWNHLLEPEELVRQMKLMKAQWLRGFIMHPRSGLLTPYLSSRWFDTVEFCVRQAAEIGLEAWLYDEDPYPSGAAGGKLTAQHPEFRARSMHILRKTVSGPQTVQMDFPLEQIYAVRALRIEDGCVAEERDLTTNCGTLRTDWRWADQWNTYYPTTYSKARPQKRSDTYHPFYRLECSLPEGQWEILCFYATWCGEYAVYPSFTDLLNPDAVRCFLEMTYEPYRRRLSAYFGNTIPGVFLDEPKFLSDPYPWSDTLIERFFNMHGYDIWQAMYALQIPLRDARKRRRDFWKTVEAQFHEAFTAQVKTWCDQNGLLLIGHSSPEEEPADQVLYTGNLMHFMRTLSWPGTDLITRVSGDRRTPIVNLGPKLAGSVLHQQGGRHSMSESFAVMEWGLTLDDMVRYANWQLALGVNTFVLSMFSYSIDGFRKMDAAPSEFYQSPYYVRMRTFCRYLERMGALMGTSHPVIHTALLYPFDSFMAMRRSWQDESASVRDAFMAVFDSMLRHQIQFDLIDEDLFLKADAEDGCLCAGAMRYTSVVVPPLWYCTEAFRKKLCSLRSAGVNCVTVGVPDGKMPTDCSLTGTVQTGFSFCKNWNAFLQQNGISLEVRGADRRDYLVTCLEKDSRIIWLLANLTEEKIELSVRETSGKKLQIWDPDLPVPVQMSEETGAYRVHLSRGSAICLTAESKACSASPLREIAARVSAPERGTFSDNCLILDRWMKQTGDRTSICYAAGRCVTIPESVAGECTSQTVVYKTSVHLTEPIHTLRLVREASAFHGTWRMYANGVLLDHWTKEIVYDANTYVCSLSEIDCKWNHFYESGELVLCVELERSTGEDGFFEPLRLMGDFCLQLNDGTNMDAQLSTWRREPLRWGTLTEQGYPNFSGSAELKCTVTLDSVADGADYWIGLETGGHTADVVINDVECGTVYRQPFLLPVTKALHAGDNLLCIRLYSTLENLLYNKRTPLGVLEPPRLFLSERGEE